MKSLDDFIIFKQIAIFHFIKLFYQFSFKKLLLDTNSIRVHLEIGTRVPGTL